MSSTRPNAETRDAEKREANVRAGADRPPTDAEAGRAEEQKPDRSVAQHEEEMMERGARQKGEGRISS